MKQVIYTSIFGKYDRLIDPLKHSDEIDYICFTNNCEFTSSIWEIKLVPPILEKDMTRSARYYKICAHRYLKEYDYSLYIDGNMRLRGVPNIKEMLNDKTIAMERHRKRKCLYEEAKVCKERGLDDPKIIEEQIEMYRQADFPTNAGLYASYMIARKHNETAGFNDLWWSHVLSWSRRDQISLPVIFYKYPIEPIPSNTRRRLVTIMRHRKR